MYRCVVVPLEENEGVKVTDFKKIRNAHKGEKHSAVR